MFLLTFITQKFHYYIIQVDDDFDDFVITKSLSISRVRKQIADVSNASSKVVGATSDSEDDFVDSRNVSSNIPEGAVSNEINNNIEISDKATCVNKCSVLMDILLKNVDQYGDSGTEEALTTLIKKMSSVKTPNQLNSILHSSGSSLKHHGAGRGKIPCQPTSIARRQVGTPRGMASIGKGRKRQGSLLSKTPKRQRNLALNVSQNVPNAKSH